MDPRGSIEQARRIAVGAGRLEEESEFRSVLAGLACTGLQWGGLLGIVGVLILVPVNVGLLGRPVAWWYPGGGGTEALVLWDKALVTLLCAGAVWAGRTRSRVSVARAVGGAIALAIAVVSLVHDAYRGVLSIEYVILLYLLTVVVIPYRPWQTLLLGGVLGAVLYGLGSVGLPGTGAARPDLVAPGHLVRMGFVTVVLTGVSTLLYAVRHRRYRARRRAETLHEQVAQLERAKSRFFADLSHEFRTPLTLILGPLRQALGKQGDEIPGPLRERLGQADRQARRMARLVDQLYDLARFDEGDLALQMRPHDLVELIRTVVPPLRQWAQAKGLTVQEDVGPESLAVPMDVDRVRQLVTTLLSNAIRHTPEEGTVRLRVRRGDDAAEIAVRDTGPGLPEALQKRVFGDADSYVPVRGEEEAGSTASTDPERWIGWGIGLAHARALVRRHGGDIDVESEPGFGTELTVCLPLGRDPEAAVEGPVAEAAVPSVEDGAGMAGSGRVPAGEPPTSSDEAPPDAPAVLIVDDEAEMRAYLQNLLGSDYRRAAVADADAALDRLRDRSFDLVLCDASLPAGGGKKLCRAIREDDDLRHLPILLLTARPNGERAGDSLDVGADAYVSKPFDPSELQARVENLIGIRQIVQDRVRLPDWMAPEAETTVSSEEEAFLESLNDVVTAHIDNSNFGVDWLADEMDLSARHLRRRIKDATGLSASGFIRTRRLQRAAALLRQDADTVSDVAAAVGYRDPSYFSRLFRETFGCPPTEYAAQEAPEDPDMGP